MTVEEKGGKEREREREKEKKKRERSIQGEKLSSSHRLPKKYSFSDRLRYSSVSLFLVLRKYMHLRVAGIRCQVGDDGVIRAIQCSTRSNAVRADALSLTI